MKSVPPNGGARLTPRLLQLPLLQRAALILGRHHGQEIVVANFSVLEVKLEPLLLWLTPFGFQTNLDIWDDTRGGAKVLNMNWGPDGKIELLSFRRGAWETFLLAKAKRHLH